MAQELCVLVYVGDTPAKQFDQGVFTLWTINGINRQPCRAAAINELIWKCVTSNNLHARVSTH